jgi:hypothetical protein
LTPLVRTVCTLVAQLTLLVAPVAPILKSMLAEPKKHAKFALATAVIKQASGPGNPGMLGLDGFEGLAKSTVEFLVH